MGPLRTDRYLDALTRQSALFAEAADPRKPVWSWADDHSVGFWARRMAHETAVHLHSTDPGLGEAGEWIPHRTPSGPVWEHGHVKGDVAVRGPVVDLLLVLTRRVPPAKAPITVLGDASLLEHWLAHTRF